MRTYVRFISWKIVPWILGTLILLAGTVFENTLFSAVVVYTALAVVFVPMFLLLFLQICIWVHNALFRGDPFYEEVCSCHPAPARMHVCAPHPKKRPPKYCPVCKRESRCRLTRSPVTGTWVHVVRG